VESAGAEAAQRCQPDAMPPPDPVPPRVLAPPPGAPTLAREPLEQGTNFWIGDDALAGPHAVRARLLAHRQWNLGYPHRAESWPGMRFPDALDPDELARAARPVVRSKGSPQ
jgi:hypothetical protein